MIRRTNVHEIYENLVNAELLLSTYTSDGNAVKGNVENISIGAPTVHRVSCIASSRLALPVVPLRFICVVRFQFCFCCMRMKPWAAGIETSINSSSQD